MTNIIISIVAFLLTIFPFSQTLLATHQQLTYPGEQVISDSVIDAIKSNDVQAIEDMLSEETQQNMADPKKSIRDFFQTIEGEIVEVRRVGMGGSSSESGAGYVYKVETWGVEVETTQNTYRIMITWVIADTRWPEHCGLVGMTIYDNSDSLLAEIS